MSPCIMGLTTQDPYIQKEHTELYRILKFRVNWANIEQDTAIQKISKFTYKCIDCRTLARKSIHFFANFEVFEWLYLLANKSSISARPQRQTNAEGCRIIGDLDQLKSQGTMQKTVD